MPSKNWTCWKTRIHKVNLITKNDARYIAGLFDGEGSICLGRCKSNKTETYYLGVSITNTNLDILNWVKETVGKGYLVKKKSYNSICKQGYEWKISGVFATQFLKKIYPYLKIKRLQAEVAFKFDTTIQRRGTRTRLTQEVINLRENLRKEMITLNGGKQWRLYQKGMFLEAPNPSLMLSYTH